MPRYLLFVFSLAVKFDFPAAAVFSGPLIVGLFSLSAINTSTVAISAQVKQTHTRATMLWSVVDKTLFLLLQSKNGVLV